MFTRLRNYVYCLFFLAARLISPCVYRFSKKQPLEPNLSLWSRVLDFCKSSDHLSSVRFQTSECVLSSPKNISQDEGWKNSKSEPFNSLKGVAEKTSTRPYRRWPLARDSPPFAYLGPYAKCVIVDKAGNILLSDNRRSTSRAAEDLSHWLPYPKTYPPRHRVRHHPCEKFQYAIRIMSPLISSNAGSVQPINW